MIKTIKRQLFVGAPLAFLITVGPTHIEQTLFPVAETTKIQVYHRTIGTLCWEHTLYRLRASRFKWFAWTVWDENNPGNPSSLASEDPTTSTSTSAPSQPPKQDVGNLEKLNQCFTLPPSLSGTQRTLVFHAVAGYRVWHGLYPVGREIGPFRVKGIDVTSDRGAQPLAQGPYK